MAFAVIPRAYGVLIKDLDTQETVAVEVRDLNALIEDLTKHLPTPETHNCSCHARNEGSCGVCKALGCKVWDFNQAAMPHPLIALDDSVVYVDDEPHILKKGELWFSDFTSPMFTLPDEMDNT